MKATNMRTAKQEKQKTCPAEVMTRTERRQERTRRALIGALRKLVAEKGVEAVTIREIVENADVALGSFYSYFDSKEVLVSEAVREIIFEAGEYIDAIIAGSGDPVDIIATAFTSFERMVVADPLLGRFMIRVNEHSPDIAESLIQRLARDLRIGAEQGRFEIAALPTTLALIEGGLMNFFRRRLLGEIGEEDVVQAVRMMLRMLGVDDRAALKAAQRAWEERNDAGRPSGLRTRVTGM